MKPEAGGWAQLRVIDSVCTNRGEKSGGKSCRHVVLVECEFEEGKCYYQRKKNTSRPILKFRKVERKGRDQ